MKKMIALLFVSGLALAQMGSEIVAAENQALTRAAPALADFTVTSGSTIGKSLDLADVAGFRVSICAEATRTLSGAGNLRAYWYDLRASEVMRNPSLDLAVTGTTKCQVFPDQMVVTPRGRVLYVSDGVTVSAGTTVDVRITGWRKR